MFLNGINNLYTFILGCCIGSFINVVIRRLPKNESIISPRSKCFNCGYQIRWFDNIPIFSWILLSGKCRSCKKKISLTYPLIEFFTGFLFILSTQSSPSLYQDFQITSFFYKEFLGFIFVFLCLTLAILDAKYFWLPDIITLIGTFIGLISSLLLSITNKSLNFDLIINTFSGTILGFLIFYSLSFIGKILFKKPVLGGGDAKLAALLGAWLGIKGLLITIWFSFNTAGIFIIIGLIFKKITLNQKIPFGVFLVTSGLLVWHFGNEKIFDFLRINL